ncbi:hypothetical protein EJ03DRAFT_351683 [Teratosphaeria nubilosa]|uniref:Cytochrome P450 n=1 Tax=Teratosphaeria nubilosa TaxID=161662 RepID=A0A6G1L7X7_9PEZI|nr:hypothetical protein EJ03DRAFT_351683 [Teratosphaeria nubilosa]
MSNDKQASSSQPERRLISSNLQDCLKIIGGRQVQNLQPINKFNPHIARSIPNHCLVVPFGLSNSFTAPDLTTSNLSRKGADGQSGVEGKLCLTDEQWKGLALGLTEAARREFDKVASPSVFEVVQMLTLKIALRVLYDRDPSDTSRDDAILTLAKEINAQWLRSKEPYDPPHPPKWRFKDQESLVSALSTIFPDFKPDDPETNPLNALIPCYETVWRVSLRCFLELTSRDHPAGQAWCTVVKSFVARPEMDVFLARAQGVHVTSPEDIAREALRLYSPTRRIYRTYKDADGNQVLAAADIEALHREAEHWGEDALIFKPERMEAKLEGKDEKQIEQEAFLPFASRPFVCPARRKNIKGEHLPFGPAIIALIVGVLVNVTECVGDGKGGWKFAGGLPTGELPLETGREACGELRFVRH